jgi:hypothetical protein
MTLIKNLIFATPCLAILTACNGNSDGGGTSNTQFTLSRVQVVSEINRPTKVLSYDASQAGEQYSGYMVKYFGICRYYSSRPRYSQEPYVPNVT